MGLRRTLNQLWVQLHASVSSDSVYFERKRIGTYTNKGHYVSCLHYTQSDIVDGFVLPISYFLCDRNQLKLAFASALIANEEQNNEFIFSSNEG